MAGLKSAQAQIGADGVTVTVTAESAATAHELAAELENRVRLKEGGPGAKANTWLKNSLDRFDETLGIYADRTLEISANLLMVLAGTLAVAAWYFVLPGYEPVMMFIGALLVFTEKQLAAKFDRAVVARTGLAPWFGAIIGIILIIECVASASLQSFVAGERETGRNDIAVNIQTLEIEKASIGQVLKTPPKGASDAINERIEALKLQPVVNRNGEVVVRSGYRVGEAIGDCTGASYYVTIYCPTLIELQADLAQAKAYEAAQTRFREIGPEIQTLQAARPAQASTMALGLGVIVPVGLTFLLNVVMVVISYLAGRAKRTPLPPAAPEPPQPAPPADEEETLA